MPNAWDIAQGPDHDPPRGLPRQRAAVAGSATSVDQPATARLTGDGRLVHRGRGDRSHRPVHGRQRVLELGRRHGDQRQPAHRGPGGLSAGHQALYTAVPTDAMGPAARALLDQVKAQAKSTDPYGLAQKIVQILSNQSVYHYDTDVTDQQCAYQSQVECFAQSKRGYCLHYASTMAILLRAANPDNPIPTRLVEGFLPGDRVGNVETVRNRSRPRLGRGLLPDLRLDPVRPDGPRGRARRARSRPARSCAPFTIPPVPPNERGRDPTRRRADPGDRRDAGRRGVDGRGSPAVRAADGPPHRGRRRRRARGLAPRPARRGHARSRVAVDVEGRLAAGLRPAGEPDRLRVREQRSRSSSPWRRPT